MTTPVQLSAQSAAAPDAKPPAARAAPKGVGAAPNRMEGPPAQEGPGVFEKGVVGLKNLVIALFRTIFKRPSKQEEMAPPQNEPVPDANGQKELLAQLREGSIPFDLLNQFEKLVEPDEQKKIYGQLGASVEAGRAMARKNLLLLAPYLIAHLEQIVS